MAEIKNPIELEPKSEFEAQFKVLCEAWKATWTTFQTGPFKVRETLRESLPQDTRVLQEKEETAEKALVSFCADYAKNSSSKNSAVQDIVTAIEFNFTGSQAYIKLDLLKQIFAEAIK